MSYQVKWSEFQYPEMSKLENEVPSNNIPDNKGL